MKSHFNKSQKIVLAIIIFGILARLIPHPKHSPKCYCIIYGLNFQNKNLHFSFYFNFIYF